MLQRKSVNFLLMSLFVFMAGFTWAQDSKKQWTLQECINYAVKNNIQVKRSSLDVDADRVSLEQSKANLLPNLNARANQGYSFGRSIDPFTNQFTTDAVRSNDFSLSSNIVLFSGRQNINAIKQNKVDLKASYLNKEDTENDIMLNIVNEYLQILFNKELVATAQSQLETTRKQLERTQKLVDAGSVAQADLLDFKAQVSNDELDLVNVQNALDISKLRLMQLMQLPADDDFEIVVPDIDVTDYALLDRSADEIYAVAVETQPDIKSADLISESANLGIDIAKGGRYPSLILSGAIFTQFSSIGTETDFISTNTFPVIGFVDGNQGQPVISAVPETQRVVNELAFEDQLDLNRRENVTLTLNIPIFNRFENKAAISNAKIAKESAEYEALNIRDELRQAIEQAFADARAAAKRYNAAQNQVESLRLFTDNMEQRFNLGAANSIDFSIAKNNLFQAEADLLQAKYDFIFKMEILDFYQGKPIDF